MTSERAEPGYSVRQGMGLRLAAAGVRGLTVLTDAVPPRYRFGHWNRVLDLLAVRNGLPVVRTVRPSDRPAGPTAQPATVPDARCLIVAGALDSGGVESVVATLALGLPAHGFEVEVACSVEGRTARLLHDQDVPVTRVSAENIGDFVRAVRPDVIELQRIDVPLLTALLPWADRTVPVFHAIESYLDAAAWSALARFVDACAACVAVSSSVAHFFGDRLPNTDIQVVSNGVRPVPTEWLADKGAAREQVASALGVRFATDDVIVVGLQRFSDQKNAAGLVDAFLLAAESDPRLRLVLAGGPGNWLEVRRADILRRRHRLGNRVHLLGDSDPWTLLLAGDMYALDSFAEGGPLSAIEAVACGLPVVLSDVGFARELVDAPGVRGTVVERANADTSQAALAAERRRHHQSNRAAFARALLDLAAPGPTRVAAVPERFTERAMVAGHAAVLRASAPRPAA